MRSCWVGSGKPTSFAARAESPLSQKFVFPRSVNALASDRHVPLGLVRL
jgi:hypothetical protein